MRNYDIVTLQRLSIEKLRKVIFTYKILKIFCINIPKSSSYGRSVIFQEAMIGCSLRQVRASNVKLNVHVHSSRLYFSEDAGTPFLNDHYFA